MTRSSVQNKKEDSAEELKKTRAKTTYRWDRIRGIGAGINEAIIGTFMLYIAIKVYDAPNASKAFLMSAGSIGMLMTPIFLWIATHLKVYCNRACSFYTAFTAFTLTVTLFTNNLETYLVCAMTVLFLSPQGAVMMMQIYAQNYDSGERGRRLSSFQMISHASVIITVYICGKALDADLSYYKWVLFSSVLGFSLASLCYSRMPSDRLVMQPGHRPWHNFSLLWKDKTFGALLIIWVTIEMGNFMTLPIRMEYLVNTKYGINLSGTQAGMLLKSIPLILSFLTVKLWGVLFDRYNFIRTRLLASVFMAVSIGLFFASETLAWLIVSSVLFGIAEGGGRLVASLWITKVAPNDKVSNYLSVYTVASGLRGIIAPFAGYALLSATSPQIVGIVAIFIIGIASATLAWKSKRFDQRDH